MDCSKFWACVGKFLAFVRKFFILHEDNIIYLSNDTNISGLLNISGLCLEISSMCQEVQIVHKDCAIFYPVTQKFPDFSKFPEWYKFLECVCKSPAWVQKLWLYKNIIFVFYHMAQQISRLLKASGVGREILSICLEISRFLKKFGTFSEVFSLCPDFF